jgi:hypothetical protein
MDKRKISNIVLIIIAVLVITASVFSVRFKASPGAESSTGKGRCCPFSGRDAQQANAKRAVSGVTESDGRVVAAGEEPEPREACSRAGAPGRKNC